MCEPGLRKRSEPVSIMRRLRGALPSGVIAACASLLLACASAPEPIPVPDRTPDEVVSEQPTVALLGATGMVGGYLLREALARGYTVRALARTPAKLDDFTSQITIVKGDARDPIAIQALLRGADVVISALGPVAADGDAARYISRNTTDNILQAMQHEGISHYMVVSGAAVVMPGDDRDLLGWWVRTLAQIGLSGALQDKQAEYEVLAKSSADWMLVRCPIIEPQAYRSPPLVSLQTPPAFRVRAAEVASFMLDQIGARQFVREGPFIGSRQGM
jgi:threonine dehydrogenase-like Zn-dependent dehydrogenase